MNILAQWFPNVVHRLPEFIDSFVQTLIMVAVTGVLSFMLSTVFAVGLTLTQRDGLAQQAVVFNVLDKLINLFRSIPFIILAAALVPFTRALVGTAIGTKGAIFPLVVGITPFFTRQIQSALAGVDPGLIEAAESMGMSTSKIVYRIYLRESVPSIIRVSVIAIAPQSSALSEAAVWAISPSVMAINGTCLTPPMRPSSSWSCSSA